MKKYSVIFHPDAETDISSSYQRGRRAWGDKQAKAWAQELRRAILLPFYPSHTLDFDAWSAVTEMHDRMIAADVSTYPSRS